MPLFPLTPSKDKDAPHSPNKSPRLSLKSSFSSLRSKHADSQHSPGKVAKKVKTALKRFATRVTRRGRVASDSDSLSDRGSLTSIPSTTDRPVLAPIDLNPVLTSDHCDDTTPVAHPRAEESTAGSWQGGAWEVQRDKHLARRSRSLSFISPFIPRTRTSSHCESSSTTVEQSISDSGTLASESLVQEQQGAEELSTRERQQEKIETHLEIVCDLSTPPQLAVVEESTPKAEQRMDRDQGGHLEPSAETPFGDEEAPKEIGERPSPQRPPQDVITEPEVPDPFLLDEEGDALSEEERQTTTAPTAVSSESQEHGTPAHEISLLPQDALETATSIAPTSPAVDKNVPPLPFEESDKEEAPEISVPALIKPGLFLPIPNTDPLTTLLSKYIHPPEKRPVRDLSGEWQRSDFHTLVMTNSWRALARMARDHLVNTSPEDVAKILDLWYIRLSSLARLRLFNQTSAECTNLFAVLNAIEPPEDRAWLFDNILPFELEVMYARLKYWAGDHMGYLDALYALFHKCKIKARQAGREAAALSTSSGTAGVPASKPAKGDSVTAVMWKERGVRVCLITASQLVEMNDLPAATKLLEPLCEQPNQPLTADGAQEDTPNTSIPALRSALGRIYLQAGNLHLAARHFAAASKDPAVEPAMKETNAALFACGDGQWERASETLRGLLEKDAENGAAVNNLAVALLGQGKVQEGISVLENALKASPSSVVIAEPFLFNLSTLYELRYANAIEKKRELLVEVAKWSGDGLKTSCLKLPTN